MSNLTKTELFNIDLIPLNKDTVKHLQPVENTNVFETNSSVFAKKGLYDTNIFGAVGSEARNKTFSYIDLNIPVLHPYLYMILTSLGDKYLQVFEGKKYATFDSKLQDIVIVNNMEGSTGYTYMLTVLKKIKWNDNNSDQRRYKIELVQKYLKNEFFITKWLVLPAGLRDYMENASGVPSEDEINSIYRNLLGTCSLIKFIKVGEDLSLIDPIRLKIQKLLVDIFTYFKTLLDGKDKFIQGKFAKRAIRYGTRNVITPMPSQVNDLTDDNILTMNHTTVGIYQFIKSIAPITMNRVLTIFINNILNPNYTQAYLINPSTMKTELVTIPIKKRDEWFTMEGMNDIMNKMSQAQLRTEPVMIDKYYLLLLYDDGKKIKIFLNTSQIPDDLNKKYIRPITYVEMFYIAVSGVVDKCNGFLTRYPVAGLGGIYPTKIYLKTTTKSRTVEVEYGGTTKILKEYPILDSLFVESVSPHSSHLAKLGADFDGDSTLSNVIIRKKRVSVRNKKIVYNYGYINLENFSKGDLIKIEGNKEFYKVPENIEVLTVWNGEKKWVHPESYSIHHNLNMLSVKTRRGNTIECSDEHSLVTLDSNLNYIRTNPVRGMVIPKLLDSGNYIDDNKLMYKLHIDNKYINLNSDFGYVLGVLIGDGWVNKTNRLSDVMLASIHLDIINKLTEVFNQYGYNSKPYIISNNHKFNGYDCFSQKATWNFKLVADIYRKYIGLGSYNKKLPDFWINTNKKFRWGLLSGLLDSDGSISIRTNGKFNVNYSTVSSQLAYDIISLANSLGLDAGITVFQRKNKTTNEYIISFSKSGYTKLKKNLILLNPIKKSKLEKLPNTSNDDLLDITPSIPIEILFNLKKYINFDLDRINYYRVMEAIKKANIYNTGGYMVKEHYISLYNKYKEKLEKDSNFDFYQKLFNIVSDNSIRWEVITDILPIPSITTAYDLTTPPYCTFVIQNGIIVYDTVSLNILYTDEANKEITNFLNTVTAYTTPTGELAYSQNTDVLDVVMKTLTE